MKIETNRLKNGYFAFKDSAGTKVHGIGYIRENRDRLRSSIWAKTTKKPYIRAYTKAIWMHNAINIFKIAGILFLTAVFAFGFGLLLVSIFS